jgi:hypothetical protein
VTSIRDSWRTTGESTQHFKDKLGLRIRFLALDRSDQGEQRELLQANESPIPTRDVCTNLGFHRCWCYALPMGVIVNFQH